MTDEQKQKRRDYQKKYVKNMTDEQKQKRIESNITEENIIKNIIQQKS